jgi:hypothetical protein
MWRRGKVPRDLLALSPPPAADAERHIFFSNAQTVTTPLHPFSSLIDLKMASEKKVADNMLWGGRFTGWCSQWLC